MHRSRRTAAVAAALAGGLLVASIPTLAAAATTGEGTLDTSLSADGKIVFQTGGVADDEASAVVPLSDGRMYVAGTQEDGTASDGIVVRLKADGSLDTTFGVSGRYAYTNGFYDIEFTTAAPGPGGTLVVGGYRREIATGNADFLLVRLTSAGKPDTTFDFDGIVIGPNYAQIDIVRDLVVESDGSIAYLGDARVDGSTRAALVRRVTAAGAPDPSFNGGTGLVLPGTSQSFAEALVRRPGGGYVAATRQLTVGGVVDGVLVGIAANATVDASFGVSGSARTSIPSTQDDPFKGLGLDRSGRLVVLGTHIDRAADVPQDRLLMARFTSGGQPDTALAGTGWAIADVPGAAGSSLDIVEVAVDGKGRPVAAFAQDSASANSWRLARMTTGGALDVAFSSDGVTTVDFGTAFEEPMGLGIGSNGRIVSVGSYAGSGSGVFRMAVARFLGDRTPPQAGTIGPLTAFATSGIRTLTWSAVDDNTGVASYGVRYRSAAATSSTFGAYTTWKASTTAKTATFEGANGRTYCFSARGKDRASNVGPFGRQSCVTFPVDDRGLTRAGAWTAQTGTNNYRKTVLRSTTAGASLSFAGADYRELGLVVTTCSTCGTVKVYRGSTLLKTVSLQSATTVGRVVINIQSSSTVRSGTITIRQASAGKPVLIDGLIIGLVQQA